MDFHMMLRRGTSYLYEISTSLTTNQQTTVINNIFHKPGVHEFSITDLEGLEAQRTLNTNTDIFLTILLALVEAVPGQSHTMPVFSILTTATLQEQLLFLHLQNIFSFLFPTPWYSWIHSLFS
jgi:hypothetical protein